MQEGIVSKANRRYLLKEVTRTVANIGLLCVVFLITDQVNADDTSDEKDWWVSTHAYFYGRLNHCAQHLSHFSSYGDLVDTYIHYLFHSNLLELSEEQTETFRKRTEFAQWAQYQEFNRGDLSEEELIEVCGQNYNRVRAMLDVLEPLALKLDIPPPETGSYHQIMEKMFSDQEASD